MTKKNWIILGIVLCCIYIISPVDLLPEFLLGPLGIIDDAGVLGFMLFLIKQLWALRSELRSEEEIIKRVFVEVDDVQKPMDSHKLSDET